MGVEGTHATACSISVVRGATELEQLPADSGQMAGTEFYSAVRATLAARATTMYRRCHGVRSGPDPVCARIGGGGASMHAAARASRKNIAQSPETGRPHPTAAPGRVQGSSPRHD